MEPTTTNTTKTSRPLPMCDVDDRRNQSPYLLSLSSKRSSSRLNRKGGLTRAACSASGMTYGVSHSPRRNPRGFSWSTSVKRNSLLAALFVWVTVDLSLLLPIFAFPVMRSLVRSATTRRRPICTASLTQTSFPATHPSLQYRQGGTSSLYQRPSFRLFCAAPIPTPPSELLQDKQMSDVPSDQHSDYEKWVRQLYKTNMFHPVKMGLQNIQQLHDLLGSPMDNRMVVHIAGTNGKGSVALKIAKTIQLANPNLKVGLFCSPHVSSFRERMQVNDKLITEEQVVQLLPHIYLLCREHDIPATFFEITTALAFSYYATEETDVVVLETGLGGRLDATNVGKAPALTIITSIGLEHTRILGDTIEKIAVEKAGIMKPGRPVLVGPHVPHQVLRQCAEDKQASGYFTPNDILGPPVDATDLEDYDLENARIATAAIKMLQESHPQVIGRIIPEDIIKLGTSSRPPCRFEVINNKDSGLAVILDVAHNPPAMDYLVRKLVKTYGKDAKFRVVVGMSSDKDLSLCGASILRAVQDDVSRIHLVEAAHPRAAKLESILEANPQLKRAEGSGARYDLDDRSITKQVNDAIAMAEIGGEVLIVCGSVFLMAEAREALGFEEPRDSDYIAEVAGAGVRHSQELFGNSSDVLPTLAK